MASRDLLEHDMEHFLTDCEMGLTFKKLKFKYKKKFKSNNIKGSY